MKTPKYTILVKVILYQVVFLVFHFLYDWIPCAITRIFSGTDESVFQHMKIGFFSYIGLSLIEFLWIKKDSFLQISHLFSRLFTAVVLPFFLMVFYLLGPLLFVKIESIPGEIVFANIALICSSFAAFIIESDIKTINPSKVVMLATSILFIGLLVQFIVFTNRLPWIDIFANPPGW